MAEIHDRMPLILAPGASVRWLGEEPDRRDLMRPFAAEPMRMWPISTQVNKPENDDPSLEQGIRGELDLRLGVAHEALSGATQAVDLKTEHKFRVAQCASYQCYQRAAEDRIRELEAKVHHHEDRADRAERWLHHVSVEIEEKFFGRDKAASR